MSAAAADAATGSAAAACPHHVPAQPPQAQPATFLMAVLAAPVALRSMLMCRAGCCRARLSLDVFSDLHRLLSGVHDTQLDDLATALVAADEGQRRRLLHDARALWDQVGGATMALVLSRRCIPSRTFLSDTACGKLGCVLLASAHTFAFLPARQYLRSCPPSPLGALVQHRFSLLRGILNGLLVLSLRQRLTQIQVSRRAPTCKGTAAAACR